MLIVTKFLLSNFDTNARNNKPRLNDNEKALRSKNLFDVFSIWKFGRADVSMLNSI